MSLVISFEHDFTKARSFRHYVAFAQTFYDACRAVSKAIFS